MFRKWATICLLFLIICTSNPVVQVKAAGPGSAQLSALSMRNGPPYKIYLPIVAVTRSGSNPANQNPNVPSAPIPGNGATGQSLSPTLSWTGGDPDAGDSVTYTIYLGTSNPPTSAVSTDQSGTTYPVVNLAANSLYYWKVVAKDNHGAATSGAVWGFTTGSSPVVPGEMVTIPAGSFKMGCDPAHNGGNAAWTCDSWELLHTESLDAYQIDKNLVTNAQYAQCVTAGKCNAPSQTKSHTRLSYYNNPTYASYPVIYVDWNAAKNYCTWAGKRLPSEAEWEKAARGSADTRAYPWGDLSPVGNSNCTLGNINWGSTDIPGYCVGDTSAVGGYPAGASSYGVLDMAGNVWEWVNDWYDANYYSNSPASNPLGPSTGTEKVERGGSWAYSAYFIRVFSRWDANTPDTSTEQLGFRCAAPVTK